MKPCAQPECPALATRGDYCPVHAWRGTAADLLDGRKTGKPAALFSADDAETAAAIEQRKRIARLYNHEDR